MATHDQVSVCPFQQLCEEDLKGDEVEALFEFKLAPETLAKHFVHSLP